MKESKRVAWAYIYLLISFLIKLDKFLMHLILNYNS